MTLPKVTLADAFERLSCASLVVRGQAPRDQVSMQTVCTAFELLDWGQDHAPDPRLRKLARDALVNATFARPFGTLFRPVPAFLAPEPPAPGAA